MKGAAKHEKRGVISMANKGPNSNGCVLQPTLSNHPMSHIAFRSQWFITFKPAAHLDKKHTVFGSLVGGEEVLDTLEKIPVKPGTERPSQPIKIVDIIMFVKPLLPYSHSNPFEFSYQDPFEEYKTRQEKRRARKAQAEEEARTGIKVVKKDDTDGMNWFGTKLGETDASKGAVGGGVGKYLSLKRPLDAASGAAEDDGQKKRKVGFGNFEGW